MEHSAAVAAPVGTAPAPPPARTPQPPLATSRLGRLGLRLWHRLLTPGGIRRPTSAARLRGWARVLEWHEARTPAQVARLVRRAIWTPVRAWKEAGNSVARFGAEVEAVAGTPVGAQRRQLWWLAIRHGLDEKSYLDYQLYLPERRRVAAAYLQERELFRVGRWLNRQVPRTDGYPIADKLAFAEWCRANSLAAVPTLVEYERGELVVQTLPGDAASSLPRSDLFSKPSDGTGGHGSERWRYEAGPDGEARWIGRDGRPRSAAGLLEELAHRSLTLAGKYGKASRRMLLQPCLRNHRDLLALTPAGLCTVRLVTYRAPGGGARALRAMYKMPTGDSPADNFCYGGIIAPVDLATGRVGPAVRRRGRVLVPVERHPDTGTPIDGHRLPHWAETVALGVRALDVARGRPSIGWDIAITDDGPVLVEGNTLSNPDVAQVPSGDPLSDTPYPGALEAYVRRCVGL